MVSRKFGMLLHINIQKKFIKFTNNTPQRVVKISYFTRVFFYIQITNKFKLKKLNKNLVKLL